MDIVSNEVSAKQKGGRDCLCSCGDKSRGITYGHSWSLNPCIYGGEVNPKYEKHNANVTTHVEYSVKQKLREMAKSHDISLSRFVREILYDIIKEYEPD